MIILHDIPLSSDCILWDNYADRAAKEDTIMVTNTERVAAGRRVPSDRPRNWGTGEARTCLDRMGRLLTMCRKAKVLIPSGRQGALLYLFGPSSQ